MLDDRKTKLVKLLIALAWADGRVDKEEMEVVEAVLDSFDADDDGADKIRKWASEPRTFNELDVSDLTEDDASLVLFQAVLLTYIDGEQSEKEIELLNKFVAKIGLTPERASSVIESATARAKDLLDVLES